MRLFMASLSQNFFLQLLQKFLPEHPPDLSEDLSKNSRIFSFLEFLRVCFSQEILWEHFQEFLQGFLEQIISNCIEDSLFFCFFFFVILQKFLQGFFQIFFLGVIVDFFLKNCSTDGQAIAETRGHCAPPAVNWARLTACATLELSVHNVL